LILLPIDPSLSQSNLSNTFFVVPVRFSGILSELCILSCGATPAGLTDRCWLWYVTIAREEQRFLLTDIDVPVSSQWESKGNLYPTQIAQFGLSHWSRLYSNPRTEEKAIQQIERIATSKSVFGTLSLDFHQIEMVPVRHGIRSIDRSLSLKHFFSSPFHRTVLYMFNS
jgi:hypothetical protein